MPTVSYLITCSTETDTLQRLLEVVGSVVKADPTDQLVVLIDKDAKNNAETARLLGTLAVKMPHQWETKRLIINEHSLNNNYGEHKNFGIQKCTGDFIFQIDGDELPPEALLGENLHALLEENPWAEAYAVPRINDFNGVTDNHAQRWGWKLTPSPSIIREKIIDTQSNEYLFLKQNGYIMDIS